MLWYVYNATILLKCSVLVLKACKVTMILNYTWNNLTFSRNLLDFCGIISQAKSLKLRLLYNLSFKQGHFWAWKKAQTTIRWNYRYKAEFWSDGDRRSQTEILLTIRHHVSISTSWSNSSNHFWGITFKKSFS